MEKIQFSYRVEKQLLDALKIGAVRNNVSVSEYITNMVLIGVAVRQEGLDLQKHQKGKLDEKFIELERKYLGK